MNFTLNDAKSSYYLSTDYGLLYQLSIDSWRIIGFVEYKKFADSPSIFDVVEITLGAVGNITIGTRGIGYEPLETTKTAFINKCKELRLHYIRPNFRK